jgi:hypothetical protein
MVSGETEPGMREAAWVAAWRYITQPSWASSTVVTEAAPIKVWHTFCIFYCADGPINYRSGDSMKAWSLESVLSQLLLSRALWRADSSAISGIQFKVEGTR